MKYNEAEVLEQAHPIFKDALRQILAELRLLGWKPKIWHIKRTKAEQAEKVKKGYSKTMKSWHVDSTEGLLPAGRISYDVIQGNAADIVDSRYAWSGEASSLDFQFWKDLGRIAKTHGCSWGGDWKSFKDVAHIQMLLVEMPTRTTAVV
jgi:hypothetical protein